MVWGALTCGEDVHGERESDHGVDERSSLIVVDQGVRLQCGKRVSQDDPAGCSSKPE